MLVCTPGDAVDASHFSPAEARPRALATLDEEGTVIGTTNTVDRWAESSGAACEPASPLTTTDAGVEDRTRRACCDVDEPLSCSQSPCFFEREMVDGMGKVRDASKTEYCRSQRRSTISEEGGDDTPARRTCEEPRERAAASWMKGVEVSAPEVETKVKFRSPKVLEGAVNTNVL